MSLPRSSSTKARCLSGFRFAKPTVRAAVLMHSSRTAGFVDCSKD